MNSNPNDIREDGLRVLVQGLGPVGAVNFLRQFEGGKGNYTDEREALLDGITVDDIAARIRERKEKAG
jgi:glutamate dehydrogenase/leucine dehydrogenase